MADRETYKELSKSEEINICLNALLEISLQKLISISSSQINWKLDNNTHFVIPINLDIINNSDI